MIGYTRTWASFDLAEYKKNGDILEAAIGRGVEIFGMENANAYTFEAVKNVPMRGLCPLFTAVKDPGTATELRQSGMTLPILVLDQPDPDDAAEYVKVLHRSFLAQSAETLEIVRALQGKVMIYGGVLRLHLKVEMASEGKGFHYLNEDDSIEDLIASLSLGGTYCEGIFTELNRADGTEVNDQKISAFIRLADKLEDATGKHFAVRHFFMK